MWHPLDDSKDSLQRTREVVVPGGRIGVAGFDIRGVVVSSLLARTRTRHPLVRHRRKVGAHSRGFPLTGGGKRSVIPRHAWSADIRSMTAQARGHGSAPQEAVATKTHSLTMWMYLRNELVR